MIDIENCKVLFKKFVDNYDINNDKIYLKYYHTLRVMDFCREISESLNLSDNDIKISMLIGLLHDIGRFEQIRVYNTFIDKDSIDHADYGVNLLKNDNFMNKFTKDEEIQKLVLTAIHNHNKYMIEDNLDERTNMFCKIIRDADKLDIFRIFIEDGVKIEQTDSKISDKVLETLVNKKLLKDEYMLTKMDYYLRQVGMFYDLNYSYSLNYVNANKYVDKLISRLIENNSHETINLNKIKNSIYEFLNACQNK